MPGSGLVWFRSLRLDRRYFAGSNPAFPKFLMKLCLKCRLEKPLDEFYKNSKRGTYESPCKVCRRLAVKSANNKWRKENLLRYRQVERSRRIENKYGLSQISLKDLWITQNKSCAICRRPISLRSDNKAEKIHIDHCHVSGVVRGLLCLTCNTGIGMLNDSPDLLEAAKQYLLPRDATTLNAADPASVSAEVSSLLIH